MTAPPHHRLHPPQPVHPAHPSHPGRHRRGIPALELWPACHRHAAVVGACAPRQGWAPRVHHVQPRDPGHPDHPPAGGVMRTVEQVVAEDRRRHRRAPGLLSATPGTRPQPASAAGAPGRGRHPALAPGARTSPAVRRRHHRHGVIDPIWDFHPTTIDDLAYLNGQVYVRWRPLLTAMGTDIDIDDVIAISHDTRSREDLTAAAPCYVDAIVVALPASTAAKMGRAS